MKWGWMRPGLASCGCRVRERAIIRLPHHPLPLAGMSHLSPGRRPLLAGAPALQLHCRVSLGPPDRRQEESADIVSHHPRGPLRAGAPQSLGTHKPPQSSHMMSRSGMQHTAVRTTASVCRIRVSNATRTLSSLLVKQAPWRSGPSPRERCRPSGTTRLERQLTEQHVAGRRTTTGAAEQHLVELVYTDPVRQDRVSSPKAACTARGRRSEALIACSKRQRPGN